MVTGCRGPWHGGYVLEYGDLGKMESSKTLWLLVDLQ